MALVVPTHVGGPGIRISDTRQSGTDLGMRKSFDTGTAFLLILRHAVRGLGGVDQEHH